MYYGTHHWYFGEVSNPNEYIHKLYHFGLDDLYLTGSITKLGYWNLWGEWWPYNPPINTNFDEQWRRRTSYDILGRICHLLGDMSVPAHAHNDAHSPLSQAGRDTYEVWVENGGYSLYSAIDALNQGGIFMDVLDMHYPIRYLLYVMNQYSDFFPSDGDFSGIFIGDTNYNSSFTRDGLTDNYPILDEIYSGLGTPPSSINCSNQGNHLMPFAIRATASLLLKFAELTGQYQKYLDITVMNDFEYGQIEVDNDLVNSPLNDQWVNGSEHSFNAIDQDYQVTGQPNYFREFDMWNLPGNRINMHRSFSEFVTITGIYEAKTRKRFEYTASNNFLNGGSGGYLKINGQIINNLPYSNYVLENNTITTEAPQQEQIVNGLTVIYNFIKWSTGPEMFNNPRTFTPSNHFDIEAEYKGHLASSTTSALTFNNQRKIVFDGQIYHMVYEDQGEIYYTYSEDDGVSWANEIMLSDGSGENKYPSISVGDLNGDIHIVVAWASSNLIFLKCKKPTGWLNEIVVDIISTEVPITPVVTFDEVFFIVWKGSNQLYIRSYNSITNNLGAKFSVLETTENSSYPSLEAGIHHRLHMAWEEEEEIYYSKLRYDGYNYNYEVIKECVSKGSSYSKHGYPSITTDWYSHPSIMWQAYSGPATENQIILHRKRADEVWGDFSAFLGNGDYLMPSITGFPNVGRNNKLDAVWSRESDMIWIAKYNGSSWSDFWSGFSYATEPTVSSNMTTVEVAKMAFRNTGVEPPYFLSTSSEGLNDPPSENLSNRGENNFVNHRRGVLSIGKAEIAYELGEFIVNGNSVKLYRYPDTISVGHNGRWEEIFRTEPFTVSGQTSLSFLQAFEILNRDSLMNTFPNKAKIEFRLEVVEARTGQVLASPNVHVVTHNLPPDSHEVRNLIFNIPGSWNVYLRVGLQLPASLEFGQSMVEAYYIEDSGSKQGSLAKNAEQEELTPTQFQLFQNYPNPFNPQTVIRFALPQQANVKLTIYDVSGRKVRTLVNENMAAGYHNITWNGLNDNGAQVGTGVYFYHITAGDFSEVRKMLLVR